jgi:hypothetical protein
MKKRKVHVFLCNRRVFRLYNFQRHRWARLQTGVLWCNLFFATTANRSLLKTFVNDREIAWRRLCVYVCIYTYTHIRIYAYTHIHVYTYIHIYIYIYIYVTHSSPNVFHERFQKEGAGGAGMEGDRENSGNVFREQITAYFFALEISICCFHR